MQLIIVSDAGADPKVSFEDLANAIEKVRVDFGARIQFINELDLEGLVPGSVKGVKAKKFNLAARGYALAEVTYHDQSKGILVLIKSTLTDNLPADLPVRGVYARPIHCAAPVDYPPERNTVFAERMSRVGDRADVDSA